MSSVHTSDSRTELWLLRSGSTTDLAVRLACFAETALGLVLCCPGGPEEHWAGAFAKASGAPLERSPALAHPAADESEAQLAARAWPPVEGVLTRGLERVLAVLPVRILQAVVARGLALDPRGASAMHVDPGRAVLLRTGPSGLVLRRSNVLAPDRHAGTALPEGRSGGAR